MGYFFISMFFFGSSETSFAQTVFIYELLQQNKMTWLEFQICSEKFAKKNKKSENFTKIEY